MAVTIIAVNQTAGALSLPNIRVANNEIAAGVDVQTNLTDFASVQQIQDDADLLGYINADQVLLNDGTKTLTKQQSINLLTPFVTAQQNGSSSGGRKEPCRAATTANITSLTTGAPSTVDGVSVAVADRILVKNQTTASENGIYEVVTVGTGADGVWERAIDADSSVEMVPGMDIRIQEGSTYAGSAFYLSTAGAITLNTTSLTFTEVTGAGADANAIHDNTAGEITAIASKAAPVPADTILIEDSEASDAKKSTRLFQLPNLLDNFVYTRVDHIQETNVTLSGGTPNTIKGETLGASDRVLVLGQSSASENGIYTVQTVGTGSDGTWVRATDMDTGAEFVQGGLVTAVVGGTGTASRYAAPIYQLRFSEPFVLDTTAVTWDKLEPSLYTSHLDTCHYIAESNIANIAGGAPNTIDGETLFVGDRILVTLQTNIAQNGIYEVQTVGTGSDGTWTLAADYVKARELLRPITTSVGRYDGMGSAYATDVITNIDQVRFGQTLLMVPRPASEGGPHNYGSGHAKRSIFNWTFARDSLNEVSALPTTADDETVGYDIGSIWITTTAGRNEAWMHMGSGLWRWISGHDRAPWKRGVRAATTANIADLAAGAPNTLDGVSLAANDRVLVKDQSTPAQNGVYLVITVGTGADGAWVRDADFDGETAVPGMVFYVSEGTAHADQWWYTNVQAPITVGTTSITFTQLNLTATNGPTTPGTTTNTAIVLWGDTTGGSLTNSNVTIDGSDNVAGPASLDFAAQGSPIAHNEGLIYYDNTSKSHVAYNDASTLSISLGRDQYMRVRNESGATLTKGSVVYVSGYSGAEGLPLVALALANAEGTSDAIGVIASDIANAGNGYAIRVGMVTDIDTSAFAAAAEVWLSDTVAGALTSSRPIVPERFSVHVGVVLVSNATTGILCVDIDASTANAAGARIRVEKGSAGTINPGQAVYQSGYNNGNGTIQVELAQSNSTATMPAIGVAETTITNSSEGVVLINGNLGGLDTTAFTGGDPLYISSTVAGGFQITKPTGTDLIQKIGHVGRSNVSVGEILIFGSGRTNDTPNILEQDLDGGNNDLTGIKTATFDAEYDNGSQTGTTYTVDWNNGQRQRITLGNTMTLSFTAPLGPGNFLIKLIQDGTGNRDITWPGTTRWTGGTAPVLSNGAGAIDIVTFYFDGTNYYGQAGLNFQA